MALSHEQRKELLALNLPESERLRQETREYMARTGLALPDMAARIGYSRVALDSFMRGAYQHISGNDAPIRKALSEFMTAHPIAAIEETEGRLYETENVRLLRTYFYEALNRGRAYYVEGDPGTQKSFVLRHLVAELNRTELAKNSDSRHVCDGRYAYYVYCPEKVRPTQLMKAVAEACGTLSVGDARRIIRNLRFDFRTQRGLFIFDEAQHLSVSCLETVRELHDLPPNFGLLFAGSHQLERMFTRYALELEQWNSRFYAGRRLPGISEDEAKQIIRGELGEQANSRVIDRLIRGSRTKALSSHGQHEYISARRLFNVLRDLTEATEATPA